MSLSEFEISKIAEIVAGRIGQSMDAKALRNVIDQVVDNLQEKQGNPEVKGATCETSASQRSTTSTDIDRSSLAPPDESLLQATGGLYDQIKKGDKTRIIVAAFGHNRPGVIASITDILAEISCNLEDISQTIMQEFFSMIMIVDISNSSIEFSAIKERLQETEARLGMKVYVMHEDIFGYMHRI